jgi:S-DNA-T family DNA segregation ATPase FtsK/SpoIIIE
MICAALTVFFLFAGFQRAGVAGELTYQILDSLFGVGYYLIPLIFALLCISFLRLSSPNFVSTRIIGGLAMFVSTLGIIGITFNEKAGGVVGYWIALPLLKLFDIYFSLVFLTTILIISILVIFDTHLSLEPSLFGKRLSLFKKKETQTEISSPSQEEVADAPVIDKTPVQEVRNKEKEEENKRDQSVATKPKTDGIENISFASRVFSFGKKTEGNFTPPPLSLLESDSGKPGVGDIKANSNIIKRTLANFGINVEMDEISIGPSITRYALKPAEGVKLSRIVALQNDLSLALAAHPIRIEAPIPGKSLVGIEIPNKTKSIVGLAGLIGSKEFMESPHPLFIALGRGISGLPHFSNLAKAPHMLIAGATGSGKSVTIHTIVTSLLYRNPPERLRFIMIDPKRVELTAYNKVPHLLTPVITDPKKAIAALRWCIKEMERRYEILEKEQVRDIQSYHKNILPSKLAKLSKAEAEDEYSDIERMPYIVIIIDELADIMSTYPRELEASVVRLAQMSRAVGIHLILSTQRPSVEIITGLIKANIPSRIALQVASQIDSRTIIDMAGAEKLLGAGDMLYISGEMSKPVRIQSAFITEEEVKKVAAFLAEHYAETIPQDITMTEEARPSGIFSTAFDADNDDDELYEAARQSVIEAGKASASYLQRKLKVGYARAARLLDMLEERGVIGPGDGAKPREVLVKAPEESYNNDQDNA